MQHDFNIANQGFPATRADINNAFQAIASNSSGPTAPSTTYANMWWYDTTNNKMYLRNEADSAWIEVATIDQTNNEWQITTGVVQAKDGDGLALKTDDGIKRLALDDATGDVEFYEDTGTDVKMLWDASAQSLEINGSSDARDHSLVVSGDDTGGVTSDLQRWKTGLDTGKNLDLTYSATTNNFDFNAGDRDLTFTTSGNVGIGTSSPASALDVRGIITMDAKSDTTNPRLVFAHDNFPGVTFIEVDRGTDAMEFWNQGSERMRIDSSGNLLVGRTSRVNAEKFGIYFTGATHNGLTLSDTQATGDFTRFFANTSTQVGSISHSSSSTSYNTSSDYRLKENVTDVTDGITRVKQLAPKRFNFIADPNTTVDGFIAHEAQAVVPEAITGTKDAMRDEEYVITAALGEVYTPAASATYDDDGNELTAATDEVIHSTDVAEPETLADGQLWRETTPAVMGTRTVPDYQGIDQAKLVPLLTAALQEAIAKIEDLEARVAALESA